MWSSTLVTIFYIHIKISRARHWKTYSNLQKKSSLKSCLQTRCCDKVSLILFLHFCIDIISFYCTEKQNIGCILTSIHLAVWQIESRGSSAVIWNPTKKRSWTIEDCCRFCLAGANIKRCRYKFNKLNVTVTLSIKHWELCEYTRQ